MRTCVIERQRTTSRKKEREIVFYRDRDRQTNRKKERKKENGQHKESQRYILLLLKTQRKTERKKEIHIVVIETESDRKKEREQTPHLSKLI